MKNVIALVVAASLAACSTPRSSEPAPAPIPMLTPNSNLVLQGIPPIPESIKQDVAKYSDFRGHAFVDWHPTRREMLVTHRKTRGKTSQLFRVTAPMAEPEPLTNFADPVTTASYEPRDGRYIVFERRSGDNEATQLYRLDLASKEVTLLSDLSKRNEMQGWLHRRSQLLVSSTPVSKRTAPGERAVVKQTLSLIDPSDPQRQRRIIDLTGAGWYVSGISPNDTQLALVHHISAEETQLWLLDIATARLTQILPAPKSKTRAVFLGAGFKPDNSGLFVITNQSGEFSQLMFYRFASKQLTPVTKSVPWDVSGASMTDDGKLLSLQVNVEGRDELRLFDARSLKELPAPKLPTGTFAAAAFHRKLPTLAFSLSNAQGPSQVHTLNLTTGATEQWTRPSTPEGIDPARFSEPQIVRWTTFDARLISGLINLPPGRFSGKRPVIVLTHSEPDDQARMGFLSRINYLIDELGVAIIQPNVRGSSGYGKSFLALDNGRLREDAIKDIGALFDWIETQPNLDASRVLVSGGGYGGYMSLAVAAKYPHRIAGAIDVAGITDFLTFMRNSDSYSRDLLRLEYGDERDPGMREFLSRISPLNAANRITRPLFVVQGVNDPIVPYTDTERLITLARDKKNPVWYLRADNEGHGFSLADNADFQFYATIMFVRETLLK